MIRAGSGPGKVDTLLSGVRGISGDLDKDFEPDADEEDVLRNKSGWRWDGNPCPIGPKATAAAERGGGGGADGAGIVGARDRPNISLFRESGEADGLLLFLVGRAACAYSA